MPAMVKKTCGSKLLVSFGARCRGGNFRRDDISNSGNPHGVGLLYYFAMIGGGTSTPVVSFFSLDNQRT